MPIPGTRRRDDLEQNLAALDVALDDEDLRRLDSQRPAGDPDLRHELGEPRHPRCR